MGARQGSMCSTGQHQFCMQRALLYAWIQECRMIMWHSCVVFWQRRVHTKIDLCRVCVALVHAMIGSAKCCGFMLLQHSWLQQKPPHGSKMQLPR
jgi:hypothetical protein